MSEDSYERGYQQQTLEKHSDQLRDARQAKPVLRHQLAQFQRTERSQRNKDTETEVEAEYAKGQGGKVKTLSRFGKANLSQEFVFGSDGDLIGVTVEKRLKRGFLKTAAKQLTSGETPLPPEMSIRLSRNQDGKFEVTQRSSTPDLEKWEEEFSNHLRKNSTQPHEARYSEYHEYGEPLPGLITQKQNTNKPT